MPFRLLVYMVAIWLDYFKNSDKNKRRRKDYRLPAVMPIVLYNGERSWTASRSFKKMINRADTYGKYAVDFEYILVSVSSLAASKIKDSNTLVDNILLADRKRTGREWRTGSARELAHRVKTMEPDDMNEWITWFSNVRRELNEEERRKFIEQLREGDEEEMCSSFERILNKEKAEGRIEGKAEGRIEGKAEERAEAVLELLEDIGELSKTLRKHIMAQTDLEVLRSWHRIAARAESVEDFEQAIGRLQT